MVSRDVPEERLYLLCTSIILKSACFFVVIERGTRDWGLGLGKSLFSSPQSPVPSTVRSPFLAACGRTEDSVRANRRPDLHAHRSRRNNLCDPLNTLKLGNPSLPILQNDVLVKIMLR